MGPRLQIGSVIAGYRVDALIARGGMGVVYRATHLGLERPVALKVIARELVDRGDFRERFQRESRLAARLDHPAVVPIFDSREVDGELLVAMRLVEGGDLRRLLDDDGPLPPERAVDLLAQIADALDAAHAAGIVHRDLKPHNVLVEGDRAFLSDFGLAKAIDESGAASGASVVGTAEYMAPEQWRGGSVGPAADIYALGCVLFEAVTGIPPYARRESQDEPRIPEGLAEVIERAVDPDPAARFHSAGALINAARQRQGSDVRPTAVLAPDWDRRRTAPLQRPTTRRRPVLGPRPVEGRGSRRKVGFAVLGAVALAAVAAVLIVVLTGGGGGGVSVTRGLTAGSPPVRLAAAGSEAWAVSEAGGSLTVFDFPEGTPVQARHSRFDGSLAGVAFAGASAWVTDAATGELLRFDRASGRLVERIHIGGKPGAIAVGSRRVWVADEDGAGITGVNVKSGDVFRRGIAPHSSPLRLALGAGALWVTAAANGTLTRINVATGNPSSPIPVGRGPSGVTVADGYVWIADSRSGTVVKVDPATRTVVGEPIELGGNPGGLGAGPDLLWVALTSEGAVQRIEMSSGELDGDPIPVGPEPGAVAVGGEAVWVALNGNGTVSRIEP